MATKKRVRKTIKARVTKPDEEPGRIGYGTQEAAAEFGFWQLGLWEQYKEQFFVNEYTALTYSVVFACVRYISQTIAGLGWHVFQSSPGSPSKERIYPEQDDVAWLLDRQASPEMNAMEFRQVLIKDALTWGNGYAEIDRDGFGRPRWLWYLSPDRVTLERDDSRRLYYKVDNGPGVSPTALTPENVFHLKNVGPDGLVGYSVIAIARNSIKLGLQTEKYGTKYFDRGPMPGGVLKVPGNPDEAKRRTMQQSFEQAYGGSKNAGRVILLTGNAEFNPLNLPNKDAEFIDSRKFQVNEICRWFGVPPHKVYDLEKATFSNIEHQSIEAVQDTHLPWCRRLESEADIKLFGRVNRGRRWTRLNLNTLLRGDSKTQTENLVSQVNTGLVTPDEAREHLDYNPYPDGLGEQPIVQGAMKPLELALEPPEPPQPAAQPGQNGGDSPQEGDGSPQEADMPKQMAAAFSALFCDVIGRQLRIETDKAKRAENRQELGRHAGEYYTAEWRKHLANNLRPAVIAILLACGKSADAADSFAEDFAYDHFNRSVREIRDGSWAEEWGNGRAAEQVEAYLAELWGAMR